MLYSRAEQSRAEQSRAEQSRAEQYASLDGMRAIAALCILMMHVFANSEYDIPLLNNTEIMPFLNNLTFLFMIISAFGMCCGYFDGIINGKNVLSSFYRKRYQKVWKYFAILVLLDFAMSPSVETFYEAFADLTLCFGLLPNANISVIGVGWFLGVIFVFYMLFPFFCFLLENKKRAWISFTITGLINISCSMYFFNKDHVVDGFYPRTSFIYCAIFFMAGGLVYLYRERLILAVKKYRLTVFIICLLCTVAYLGMPLLRGKIIKPLSLTVLYAFYLIYAIGTEGKILNNQFTEFIARISMEIYLCHMLVFRMVEKMHLTYLFGKGWMSYFMTTVFVIIGACIFSLCIKRILTYAKNR